MHTAQYESRTKPSIQWDQLDNYLANNVLSYVFINKGLLIKLWKKIQIWTLNFIFENLWFYINKWSHSKFVFGENRIEPLRVKGVCWVLKFSTNFMIDNIYLIFVMNYCIL